MTAAPVCNICDAGPGDAALAAGAAVEQALVPCNVREFKDERFPVWRCPRCRSIHTGARVDLAHYYARYPFHRQKLDLMAMVFYDNQLRRLRRAGLKKGDTILDYGCGSGHFVRFLHMKGYKGAVGYDAYSAEHGDPRVLDARYDWVVSQDVIEHAEQPLELLRRFADLCRPGGVIAVGTPNAEAIDLGHAPDFRHTLHQPYHLHILSKTALLQAAAGLGWSLLRYYPRQYSNTAWPFLNQAFCLHYARLFDDTVDLAFDGPRFARGLLTLRTLLLAFFGYFFSVETDVMAVFRNGA